jgi:hypothetical protein
MRLKDKTYSKGSNMKLFIIVFAFVAVTACGRGDKGDSGSTGPTGPVAVPAPVVPPNLDSIADVMQEYNEGRVAQGQDPVTVGLACSLYTVPATTTQIVGATLTSAGSWTYSGVFNDANGNSSPGLSILPASIRSLYTSYYIIKCTGLYVAPAPGYYEFDLSSDDGANLSVNGALINNDGVHGITTKSGMKFLNRGVYSFELDYLDIGGSHALMLKSGGVPVPAANFYH